MFDILQEFQKQIEAHSNNKNNKNRKNNKDNTIITIIKDGTISKLADDEIFKFLQEGFYEYHQNNDIDLTNFYLSKLITHIKEEENNDNDNHITSLFRIEQSLTNEMEYKSFQEHFDSKKQFIIKRKSRIGKQ